jgi:hypothetical protein
VPHPPHPPQAIVVEGHFRLLREYGRNPLPHRISDREQRELWRMMCQTAGLPHVERERVVEEWKRFIGGQSKQSSIAINGDIDPRYTTLGIAFHGKLSAAHTTKTSKLLERVMKIYARAYPNRDTFLDAAETLCRKIADRVFGPQEKR